MMGSGEAPQAGFGDDEVAPRGRGHRPREPVFQRHHTRSAAIDEAIRHRLAWIIQPKRGAPAGSVYGSGSDAWTAEQKAQIVAESYESDEKVSAVARRHGLTPQQLFGWRPDARRRGGGRQRIGDARQSRARRSANGPSKVGT